MKAIRVYFCVFVFVFLQSFTSTNSASNETFVIKTKHELKVETKTKNYLTTNQYNDLMVKLAKKESGSNWRIYSKVKNKKGQIVKAIGKYQFMPCALKQVGFGHITYEEFVKNPNIFPEKDQELAMKRCLAFNKKVLAKHITKYVGTTMNGVLITEQGILAMAHLAGAGGAMKYLDSNGKNNPKDANNTHAGDYLKNFN